MVQLLFVECLQVVSTLPVTINDFIWTFPVGSKLPLNGIIGGRGHFPEDKVLDAEVSRLYLGILVFCHKVLVSGHSLHSGHPYLVQ